MRVTRIVTGGASAFAGALLATALAMPASGQEIGVSTQRLINADRDPANWLTVHQNYQGHRYTRLTEINRETVGDLQLAFAVGLPGIAEGGQLQGTPLVDSGFMYVTNAWGAVIKIDVRDGKRGKILWVMDPGVDTAVAAIHANRGATLWRDQIIVGTIDGRLISASRETGEITWEQKIGTLVGEAFSGAPLTINDKIVIGQSAGDWGTRGWVGGYDARNGDLVWKTHTIPAPGEPGSETWADDHSAWKTGGAAPWVTGTYDPESNLTFWGTGNPVPMFDPEYRPGDNLWSDSALAFDADTGEMKWGFQVTPNEYLDYDEEGVWMFVPTEIDGRSRNVLSHFGRNGFHYTLDAATGEFMFGQQYVNDLTWAPGIDPKTGKPLTYDPSKLLQVYGPPSTVARRVDGAEGRVMVEACPTIGGGVNYQPPAYSPRTSLLYGSGAEGCSGITVEEVTAKGPDGGNPFGPAGLFIGGTFEGPELSVEEYGAITAIDVRTGATVAKKTLPHRTDSGMLASAGGLVFNGNKDGTVAAYNDETLQQVWGINMGTTYKSEPISYAVDGRQYIAILSGGNDGGPGDLENMVATHMLYVFALPE
jgi:alcohol dehydrogenase (cytochrome c)